MILGVGILVIGKVSSYKGIKAPNLFTNSMR